MTVQLLRRVLILLSIVTLTPQAIANEPDTAHLDALTERALHAMVANDWPEAESAAAALVHQFPDFSLGQLLLSEVHRIAADDTSLLNALPTYSKEFIDLLLEAKVRLMQSRQVAPSQQHAKGLLPEELIQIGTHVDRTVVIDLDSSALYLYDTTAALPELIKKHYIGSGRAGFGKLREGDLKTPLGVYSVTGFRSDASLPDLYGAGALMLDYPNSLDNALGRTGSGIWLHGIPASDRSRGPRSSEGCVTMANDYVHQLLKTIDPERTHVLLSANIRWSSPERLIASRIKFSGLFEQYRNAWIDGDADELLGLYAPDALPTKLLKTLNRQADQAGERMSSALPFPRGLSAGGLAELASDSISILQNPSLDKQPGHGDSIVLSFEIGAVRVTQYWIQADGGSWNIKRETIVPADA